MDLTNSTKLMSTDNQDQSNIHGCQDITDGKESVLHGKLTIFSRNFEIYALTVKFLPGDISRGILSKMRFYDFKIARISSIS